MTAQLPLNLRWPSRQRFEHFYAGANAAVLAAVQALATQPGAPWLYLSGALGSGKSHLLMAACQAAHDAGSTVQYLPLRGLREPFVAIRGVAGSQFIALDDLDAWAGERETEQALFDLYNRARGEGARLIFAARAAPIQLALTLPDLRSRLAACTQFMLRSLDDDERREVLKQHAALRGIELDEVVLDWLFARYARDLGALLELLDRLDRASLVAQRRVTVPFLRAFLRETATQLLP